MRLMLLAFLSTAGPSLLAQDAPIGARVRVLTSDVIVVPGLGRIDTQELRLDGKVSRAPDTLTVTRPSGDQVTLPRPRTLLTGEVVASDADTLTLRLDRRDVRVSVPRTALEQLDVSRGRRAHGTLKGAALGGAIGAVGGAVLGMSTTKDRGIFTPADVGKMGAALFGTIGGLVGAAAGRAERWENVADPSRKVTLGVRPVGRRGLGLTLGF
jgi:hypothetical protein